MASTASSVSEFSARATGTTLSVASSLETMRTVYSPAAFSASISSWILSRKHTR